MNILTEHLNKGAYNISALSHEAKVSASQLRETIKGERPMSARMAWRVLIVLAPLNLGGWWVRLDEEGPSFIAERVIPGSIEPPLEKDGVFKYPARLIRDIITDSSDLLEFLEP